MTTNQPKRQGPSGNVPGSTVVGQALAYLADYIPFGWVMPGRTDLAYRDGFQGQEKDPETGWDAFELRMYDSRIGRWLSIDPAGQFASPYTGMGNNHVLGVDPDGAFTRFGAFLYTLFHGGAAFQDPSGKHWNVSIGNSIITGNPSTIIGSRTGSKGLDALWFLGSMTNQSSPTPNYSRIASNDKWQTQMPDEYECRNTCNAILGVETSHANALHLVRPGAIPLEYIQPGRGIRLIEQRLRDQKMSIVGVKFDNLITANGDKVTNHFVVINGAGVNSMGQRYYTFFEVGTSHISKGASNDNILTLQSDSTLIGRTVYAPTLTYRVTQVRPN